MNLDFYKAFEDRFRGDRDLIKSRLQIYLPFIKKLQELYPTACAIDLGCGRGEWLECLRDVGLSSIGIDIDDSMLATCQQMNLEAVKGDAIAYLKQLPDESQIVVSAFHLVEHLAFEVIQELVKESLRVLRPGGILITETPNPENIVVGSSRFYLDPTHIKPLPPELLSFIPEYYGFKRVKVLRLQESSNIQNAQIGSLFEVLNGVSPDYAVIAQKDAAPEVFDVLNLEFQKEYGVTLARLAIQYDQQLQTQQLSSIKELKLQVDKLNHWQQAIESETAALETRLNTYKTKAQVYETKVQALEAELNLILNSRSWQWTQPLRTILQIVKPHKPNSSQRRMTYKTVIKQRLKPVAIRLILLASQKPYLKQIGSSLLNTMPQLKQRLKVMMIVASGQAVDLNEQAIEDLSPRGRQILDDLRDLINHP